MFENKAVGIKLTSWLDTVEALPYSDNRLKRKVVLSLLNLQEKPPIGNCNRERFKCINLTKYRLLEIGGIPTGHWKKKQMNIRL